MLDDSSLAGFFTEWSPRKINELRLPSQPAPPCAHTQLFLGGDSEQSSVAECIDMQTVAVMSF